MRNTGNIWRHSVLLQLWDSRMKHYKVFEIENSLQKPDFISFTMKALKFERGRFKYELKHKWNLCRTDSCTIRKYKLLSPFMYLYLELEF